MQIISGQQIKDLREKKNLSVAMIANQIGITRQSLHAIERGATFPRGKTYNKLLEILGEGEKPKEGTKIEKATKSDLTQILEENRILKLENEVLKNEKATFIKIIENLSLAKDKDALNGSLSLWPAQSGLGAGVGASLQACA